MTSHTIELRTLPERRIASISRHGLAADIDAFFHEAFATPRSTAPGLEGIAGCPFLVFYGEVSKDSDGPVEPCRPIAGGGTGVAEGIETRVEAAHDEVYMRLGKDEVAWPTLRGALDELAAWVRANDRQPAATFRQVLIADQHPAAADALVCDLSVPLR